MASWWKKNKGKIGMGLATGGASLLLGDNPSKKIFGGGGSSGLLGTGGYKMTADKTLQDPISRLLPALERRAMGKSSSFAELAGKKTLQQNLANNQTGIRSIGGISGAMKQRMIANAASKAGSGIAEQSARLRAQEQASAEKALASTAFGAQSAETEREKVKSGAFADKAANRQKTVKAIGEGFGAFLSGGK